VDYRIEYIKLLSVGKYNLGKAPAVNTAAAYSGFVYFDGDAAFYVAVRVHQSLGLAVAVKHRIAHRS
jgi:hypothetical protein